MNDFQNKGIKERIQECAAMLHAVCGERDANEELVFEQVATEVREEIRTHGRVVSMTYYRVFGATYTRTKAEKGDAEFAGYLRELSELPQTEPEYGPAMGDKEYAALLAECNVSGNLCLEYYRRHPEALPNRRRAVNASRKGALV